MSRRVVPLFPLCGIPFAVSCHSIEFHLPFLVWSFFAREIHVHDTSNIFFFDMIFFFSKISFVLSAEAMGLLLGVVCCCALPWRLLFFLFFFPRLPRVAGLCRYCVTADTGRPTHRPLPRRVLPSGQATARFLGNGSTPSANTPMFRHLPMWTSHQHHRNCNDPASNPRLSWRKALAMPTKPTHKGEAVGTSPRSGQSGRHPFPIFCAISWIAF